MRVRLPQMTAATGGRSADVGRSSVGLALAPFAILFSFWIPTLALLLAVVPLVTGTLDLRGSTDRRRRVALLTVGLGLAATRSC
jgi:hypothetical protein